MTTERSKTAEIIPAKNNRTVLRNRPDFFNLDSGQAIENVVYYELMYREYDVAVSRGGSVEVAITSLNWKEWLIGLS